MNQHTLVRQDRSGSRGSQRITKACSRAGQCVWPEASGHFRSFYIFSLSLLCIETVKHTHREKEIIGARRIELVKCCLITHSHT